ncbi:MAG: rod shape-determining protein MreD [Sphingosinicella sp.]
MSPRARIARSDRELALRDLRLRWVPLASVLLAILLSLVPIVTVTPIIPDLGLMMLIGWRLLRPELWGARTALALGLFADLVSGDPLGQSMLLWAATFLVFEAIDRTASFRDYWMEWLVAAAAIAFNSLGAWYIALLVGSDISYLVMVPQLLLAIFAYPLVSRLVLGLDRWRFAR